MNTPRGFAFLPILILGFLLAGGATAAVVYTQVNKPHVEIPVTEATGEEAEVSVEVEPVTKQDEGIFNSFVKTVSDTITPPSTPIEKVAQPTDNSCVEKRASFEKRVSKDAQETEDAIKALGSNAQDALTKLKNAKEELQTLEATYAVRAQYIALDVAPDSVCAKVNPSQFNSASACAKLESEYLEEAKRWVIEYTNVLHPEAIAAVAQYEAAHEKTIDQKISAHNKFAKDTWEQFKLGECGAYTYSYGG